jgi:hypothetical protein
MCGGQEDPAAATKEGGEGTAPWEFIASSWAHRKARGRQAAVILGVRVPGCVAAIQRLLARVRGAVQRQEGDFPLGRRAVRVGPGVRAAWQARPTGRTGAAGEQVAAQRRKPWEKEESERMTLGVHRS